MGFLLGVVRHGLRSHPWLIYGLILSCRRFYTPSSIYPMFMRTRRGPSIAICVVVLHLVLDCEDVNCVQSTTDGLEFQKISWSDLREQCFLVLQIEDPCLIDRV